jgi:hypothetical protein
MARIQHLRKQKNDLAGMVPFPSMPTKGGTRARPELEARSLRPEVLMNIRNSAYVGRASAHERTLSTMSAFPPGSEVHHFRPDWCWSLLPGFLGRIEGRWRGARVAPPFWR